MEVVLRRVVLVTMLVMLTCAESASAALHRVGGQAGWKLKVNYSEWASNRHFYVGDWLYFGFDKHAYNVLEVNKTDYETCTDAHPITIVSRGAGRDVFNLTHAQPYYFLSSGGYCYQGMKLSLLVENAPPAPAPAPTKNGSPSDIGSHNAVPTVLAIALVWMSLFMES